MDSAATSSMDWRGQLRRNERRTRLVMIMFVVIYLGLGFLFDVYINAQPAFGSTTAPDLGQVVIALLTFHLIPYVTLITGAVATFSLWITFHFHRQLVMLGTNYKQVTATSTTLEEKQLYNVVEEMKVAAGLQFMPEIYIIDADYMNAFASGYSERSALVAITRGLLTKLDRSELQAVMAHELSHVRHQDIKLTLVATLLANFTLIIIDLLFYTIFLGKKRDVRVEIVIILLRYILPLITIILLLYLSRTREYMADAGCVELMRDNGPLGRALLKIDGDHTANRESYAKAYATQGHEALRTTAYLYDPSLAGISAGSGLTSLFSTHPSIKSRLAALGYNTTKNG